MKSFVCMFEIGKEEKGGGEGKGGGGGLAFINSVQYVYKFDQQSWVLFKLLFCLSSLIFISLTHQNHTTLRTHRKHNVILNLPFLK